MKSIKSLQLQTKMALLIVLLLMFILIIAGALFNSMLSESIESQIGKRALAVSKTVSSIQEISDAFELDNPSIIIQPLVENIRVQTGAEFIVVGNQDGIRYSHPIQDRIGKHMVGGDNDRGLLLGESYVSQAVGTLGPSIRGKVPIVDEDGSVIGIVSVGFLTEDVQVIIQEYKTKVIILIIIVLAIGILGAVSIATNFKNQIFGLEPREIAQLFIEKNAILESIHEGIIAINHEGKITLANQKAYQILALPPSELIVGKQIQQVLPHTKMLEVLETSESHYNDELQIGNYDTIVNRIPIFTNNHISGVVASFRKKTEIDQLSNELSQVQQYTEILRAQTHEYSNKLYTIAGLIQLESHQEALDLIQSETSGYQNLVHFLMKAVPNTLISALILGKYNRAHELKVNFVVHNDSSLKDIPTTIQKEKLVTILGNLLENSFEAVLELPPKDRVVQLFMTDIGHDIIFEVEDSGNGIPKNMEEKIFTKGFSTKKNSNRGYGLHLVEKAVDNLQGYITLSKSNLGGANFTVVVPKAKGETKHE
ncbi:ATP-binding protein [Cytobacillus sp. Hm23]